MANFKSNDILIYPTAYRQYVNDGGTEVINIESRLNTEYNITNLVNGLLDQNINKGNFVVSYGGVSGDNILKFCMQGYYIELKNASSYTFPLYAKIYIRNTDTNYNNMLEVVPNTYDEVNNSTRDLDYKNGDDITFLGIDYLNAPNEDYFQLLDENGAIPEQSKLRFSTNQIGYKDTNNVWHSIANEFKTNKLITNELVTNDIESQHIKDDSNKLIIENVNDDTQTNYAIVVDGSGEIVSEDHQSSTITQGVFEFIGGVSSNSKGKVSATTKSIQTDTQELSDSDEKLPTSKLVKTNIDSLKTRMSSAEDNITNLTENKISKNNLSFSFSNGILTINKSY